MSKGRASAALMGLLLAAGPAWSQTASFDWVDYRGEDPVDRAVRAGPDDYRNPILNGFYPDPSITRVGGDYYLVTSTFSYFPGLPIFHSRDLVSWTQIGNALDRPGQMSFGSLGLSRGIFAPDISEHRGIFYLAGTCVDCGGNFVMTARDPKGPWSDPHWNAVDGIDPSLFFDDDGSAWMLNNGPPVGTPRYDGHRAIWIQRFSLETLRPFGPRTVLIDGGVKPEEKPIWAEGPHIYRKDGWYYLSTAEGGTAEGHSQVIWRSRKVDGLYEPGPHNPILTQRDLDPARPMPVTSAGHADFVTTPSGQWWATFLATRPYRDDFYNIGRETFLLPVEWRDGWPVILPPGVSIPYVHKRPDLPRQEASSQPTSGAFAWRDEFDGKALAPSWLRIRTPGAEWHQLGGGALTLEARPVPLGGNGQPSFLGRRLQHHHATITTEVHLTPAAREDRAGLAILQSESHFYALTVASTGSGAEVRLERRAGTDNPADGSLVTATPIALGPADPVQLRIVMRGDRIDFLFARPAGAWTTLARDQDATILSTKTAGGFVGATVGPFTRKGD